MKRIFLETGNVIHLRSPRLGQPALDSDLGPEVSDGCPHNVAKAMGPPVSSCNTVRQELLHMHGSSASLSRQHSRSTFGNGGRGRIPTLWSSAPDVAGPCESLQSEASGRGSRSASSPAYTRGLSSEEPAADYSAQASSPAPSSAPNASSMWSTPLPSPRLGLALPSPIVVSDRMVKDSGPPLDSQ
jgi:hypothetical protein